MSYSATRDQIEFALNKAAEYIELKAKELGVNYDKDILAIQQASTFSLRQTGAYMALEDGEDISSVAENLGHVNSRVTAQIHSQQNPENRAKYISRRRVE